MALLGAGGMLAFEPAAEVEGGFESYGDALWWTAMLLVTMGSEFWPRTPEGRILCFLLALYGFSQNPFVEFYVVEAFAAHNPSDNAGHSFYGYHTSDGAQYELWSKYNGNLRQYFSVRRTNRRGGTITFNNHYRAFAAAGLPLGSLQNTFIVVEGQQGTGNADITVGVRPTGSIKETATPTTRTAVCMTTKQTIGTVCKPRATKRDETPTLVKVARAEAKPTA